MPSSIARCPTCWGPLSRHPLYPLPALDPCEEEVWGVIRTDDLGRVPRWDGTLAHQDVARSLQPHQGLAVVAHLARALARLHARGIVHRAVCPANLAWYGGGSWILVDPQSTAATDAEPGGLSPDLVGYAPPEVLARAERWGTYADVWGLGCVALDLVLAPGYGGGGQGPFSRAADWSPMGSPRATRQLRRILAVLGVSRDLPDLAGFAPRYVSRALGGRSPSACVEVALRTLLGTASPSALEEARARLAVLAPVLDATLQVDWRLRASAHRLLKEVIPHAPHLHARVPRACACL